MLIILSLLCVCFAFTVLLYISEKVFEKTNYFRTNYCETEKLKSDSNVDYINTGSTFARFGIDYELTNVHGINLAMCPQTIVSDFKLLRHFEHKYNPGANVFIVISDLAFAKKEYSDTENIEKYYKVLDDSEIDDFNFLKAIRARYFPVLYNWKNFLRFHWDIKYRNEFEYKVNENDREAVEADANNRCKAWMKEFDLQNLVDPLQGEKFKDSFAYTTNTIIEMVIWCQQKGLNPMLVNLPVSSEMHNMFSEDFLDAFYYDHIDRIIKETGIKFIDLQKDKRLSDYLLYLDSCRLNKPGRGIITRILLSECKKQK